MRQPFAIAAILAVSGIYAAEDATPPADPGKEAPKQEAPAATPDPTNAVVAERRFVYRQRDLDAMVAIAIRHAKAKLSRADEDQVRAAILKAFAAREDLMEAMSSLPSSISDKARDGIVLDLLDYQAEPVARKTPPTSGKIISNDPNLASPEDTPEQKPAPTTGDKPSDNPADGPVLVRLPPLNLVRTLDGVGKRQLTLGLALYFPNQDTSKKLEAKAPLIQDAVLGFVQKLSAAEFSEPDQVALKEGLTKAVQAKVPEFPADGLLIPQLDVSTPDSSR